MRFSNTITTPNAEPIAAVLKVMEEDLCTTIDRVIQGPINLPSKALTVGSYFGNLLYEQVSKGRYKSFPGLSTSICL